MNEHISIDDVAKVRIQIGHILSAEKVEGSEKLLKLSVDFGTTPPTEAALPEEDGAASPRRDVRTVVSGIAHAFPDPALVTGKKCAFVTNLAPRMLMGIESQAMILAAHAGGALSLLEVGPEVEPGAKIN